MIALNYELRRLSPRHLRVSARKSQKIDFAHILCLTQFLGLGKKLEDKALVF